MTMVASDVVRYEERKKSNDEVQVEEQYKATIKMLKRRI
jgi:hypothetical protein